MGRAIASPRWRSACDWCTEVVVGQRSRRRDHDVDPVVATARGGVDDRGRSASGSERDGKERRRPLSTCRRASASLTLATPGMVRTPATAAVTPRRMAGRPVTTAVRWFSPSATPRGAGRLGAFRLGCRAR